MDTESLPGGVNALVPVSQPASAPAKRVFPRVLQLTGRELTPEYSRSAHGELADPAAPWVTEDGKIRILGTGFQYLRFDSWGDFLNGHRPQRVPIALCHPDGTPLKGHHTAWDMAFRGWRRRDGSSLIVLYAGTMTPTGPRRQARWPYDNWTRRIYAYQCNRQGLWVRERLPLFGSEPKPGSGWLGHSYGHQFLDDENGQTWVFYEKVIGEARNRAGHFVPYLTEIFARKMLSPLRASEEEVRILGVGTPPYPSTHRQTPGSGQPNGFLVEGPRPVRAVIAGEVYYLLGFSSGDFPTDGYGINLAWSRHAIGPYFPLLEATAEGLDLLDLGAPLRERYGLSWGPARPSLFQDPAGHWWMLFHAVRKELRPENDYTRWPDRPFHHFHRNLYLAPLRLELNEAGLPDVKILDQL